MLLNSRREKKTSPEQTILYFSFHIFLFFSPNFCLLLPVLLYPAASGSSGPDGRAGEQCENLRLAGVCVRMDVMEHHRSNIWRGTGELIPLLASSITHLLCLPASLTHHTFIFRLLCPLNGIWCHWDPSFFICSLFLVFNAGGYFVASETEQNMYS